MNFSFRRSEEEDDSGTIFRDLLLMIVCGVVTVIVILFAHVNPKQLNENTNSSSPPGNVLVEISWPSEDDTDVDLWVQAPGDVPVGYSNKGGAVFNLLRDDLGTIADVSGLNYENSYSRGVIAGEYTVNVHLYRNRYGTLPIPVTVVVSCKPATDDKSKEKTNQILSTKVELTREGQERTALRFRLTEQCEIVPGSVNNIQKPLRDYKG